MRRVSAILLILILTAVLVAALLAQHNVPKNVPSQELPYIGVTYCGDSVEAAKLLIDRVKNCTNLFVLQSGTLQRNLASITELGDYAISAGLYFLPYFGGYVSSSIPDWIATAKQRWGSHFLGVYYDDEPGGKMLDSYVEFEDAKTGNVIIKTQYGDVVVEKTSGAVVHYEISGVVHLFEPSGLTGPSSFVNMQANRARAVDIYSTFYPNGTIMISESNALSHEQNQDSNWSSIVTYEDLLNQRPFKNTDEIANRFYARNEANIQSLTDLTKVFTSDYALYWFDYKAGYDVVLAQIGWNNSFAQNIALIRGAANLQNKAWGIILTWKYDSIPYLDSGPEILNQMRAAYKCGAKYIILFNYYDEADNPYGTLQDEHFLALEDFWNSIQDAHETFGSVQATKVLVLPKDYGCGMRWREDRIWGVIEPSEDSYKIWDILQKAFASNNLQLDIVYDDFKFSLTNVYQQVMYWNQTG